MALVKGCGSGRTGRAPAWHRAATTRFLPTDRATTVMNSGVICFGSDEEARPLQGSEDEAIADWPDYQRRRGRPDREVSLRVGAWQYGLVVLQAVVLGAVFAGVALVIVLLAGRQQVALGIAFGV